jgi:EAL domain-containing protein (putative c-di-GMP-specific phosphodiesterase class I)
MPTASDSEAAGRLRDGLERGALSVLYQPKLDLSSGSLAGVEALARWNDPERGAIPASTFVPLAERSGLIDLLTDRMLKAALRQWAAWREQGLTTRLAFNISALSLVDVTLPDRIERMCMYEGVPCNHLTVELTESATQTAIKLLDTLARFRLKGFGVSLDDFGTGYSSLMQLRQLPYSEIKIDRCFVSEVATARESRLIVKAIIDLAHAMGLRATAEGVEDVATLRLLEELRCDEAQGFLISEPLEGHRLIEWLRNPGPRILFPSTTGGASTAPSWSQLARFD